MDPPLRYLQWQQCFPVIIIWHWDTALHNIILTSLTPRRCLMLGLGMLLLPNPLPLTGVLAPALAMGPSPGLPMGSPTVPSFCSTGMSLCHGSFKNCDFKLYLASFAELLGLAKKPSFPIFKVAKWFSPLYKYCLHITLVFGI